MQIFSKELLFASDDLHGVKEFTQEGTHTFKLSRRTKVKITMVGSGQDSYKIIGTVMTTGTTYYSGYGGAIFIGGVILPAGLYSVTINKSTEVPNSNAQPHPALIEVGSTMASSNVVSLNNSKEALISTSNTLFKSSNLEIIYGTIEREQDGNGPEGGYYGTTGGASLYNGYGKGADARKHNNTLGYFKIEW